MPDIDTTISSLLGSTASAFSNGGSRRQTNLPTNSIDRALGAAASLGVSLAILRLVVYAYKVIKQLENDEKGAAEKPPRSTGSDLGDAIINYIRRFLRRILVENGHDSVFDQFNDGAMMTHQGSCHCESVCFEAVAPRCLATQDGPGKIQFRRTEVSASKFKVVKGKECLNTYYVYCKRTSRRGAHAFCGRCGVHILYAPCKDSPTLLLNVNCMAEGIRKLRSTDTLATISDGVPVEGQWDDHLSTVSETSAESAFMKRLYSQESALSSDSNGDWKTYQAYDTYDNMRTPVPSSRAYPAAPATPSTVDSLTGTDSQSSSVRIPTADQDSLINEPDPVYSLKPPPKSTMLRTPISSTQSHQSTTATPQVRDQMKYFMRKHLASPPASQTARDDELNSNL